MLTGDKLVRFLLTAWKMQLAGAMEFRASFLTQALMMLINNSVMIVFWLVYFAKFPVVKGWQFDDVIMMWAVGTVGFGIMMAFFANAVQIPRRVANGELDLYMSQPKPVLLHLLVSKGDFSAWGDLLFGILLYAWVGDHSLLGLFLFIVGSIIAAAILMSFMILVGSISFYIGNAEGLNFQVFNALIAFMTYPTDIFHGLGRVLLFTVIPAGFISYMPIGLLKQVNGVFLAEALGSAVLLALLARWAFYRGLRRYSSGNLMNMRM